jgi:hypothetical protein
MMPLFSVDDEPAQDDGLPALRGTENQVGWAARVRTEKIAEIQTLLRDWRRLIEAHERAERHPQAQKAREGYREALLAMEGIEGQDYAGWWLDRRSLTARQILAGDAPNEEDLLK